MVRGRIGKGDEKEGGRRGIVNLRYWKTQDLLKDFPNLKVGGLLPDPGPKAEGESVIETQEWTYIMFPCGQQRGRKVIRPDSRFSTPSKEGDWARHPCCGMICAARSASPLETY